MQRATVVLVAMLALARAGPAEGQTGSVSKGVPILMPPVPVVDVEILEAVVGILYDGDDFWVSQHSIAPECPPMFHRVSEQGVIQESFEQNIVYLGIGHNDGTFYDGFMWTSECYWIKKFDFTSGFDGSSYFCAPSPPFSALNPCRAVCHDDTNGRWYLGGDAPNVYSSSWTGLWGETPAWTPVTPPVFSGVRGIAFDRTKKCLWISDYIDNALYKVDPDGGPILGQIPNWGALYGSPRGISFASTSAYGDVLAALFVNERAPGRFVLFDIDTITPVESASWSSIKALYR
jgi:hypothetical protein